ncbi:choice-of-anchor J domain-containing protein [Chiayiivirga flava]|uniref:Putative repeat protein (TIGR01451 family) n=1 Tax=Chiayiivirga flava TaxID=659595 RepID=A0A7W8D796_9GAMM|nr:choice-of-anchor J domain-containing protein [Chiayiivirga flava]MBB5208007.1 putative repeat protein (TIGR01451 family) [Chiayiivirga flava]
MLSASVGQDIDCATAPRTPARGLRRLLHAAAALLLAATSGVVGAQAFNENFDDITLLPGNGWFLQNNSSPVGITAWFQGTSVAGGGPFDSFNGAANAYIGANFNNTTGGSGTISNWLVAPNRTLRNGDVLTFYTRRPTTPGGGTEYPDRLEVRMSTNGASTNVGTGGSGTGDFTTLLLSINPTLTVNVYPAVWTQFTVTVSGLPAPTSGRMAFRYFVTSAGPTGTNSDYIGIDAAAYTPYVCPAFTMTPGGALAGGTFGQAYSTTLSQTGALGAPNFAITAGALPPGLTLAAGGTISGTPVATGTFNFTVTVNDASGCSGAQNYSITVVADVPGAPQNATAVAGDTQADVSWDAPASDGGDPIVNYTATCSDGVNDVGASSPVSPITVLGLTNGTPYTCTVTATNGIGTGPASAPSNSITPIGNQTITFDTQADQIYSPGGSFAIDPPAVASSGLPVVYGSTTPAVCTVSGATVSIVAAGTCTLTADQPGDAAWNPAPQVAQSLVIAQASQTLTFPPQSPATRVFELGSTFAIDPEATSAEPNAGTPIVYSSLDPAVCTVSGTTVTMVAVGTCQIAANQAGDDNYTAAAQVVSDVELVEPTDADLSIEKTADVTRARIGDTVAYSILVANAGPADATDVHVLDLPPDRLDAASVVWQCVEAIGTDCPDPDSDVGELDVVLASLPEGASVRFELLGTVIPAADPADDFTAFDNTATVALPEGSALTDPAPANNESTASVLVIPEAIFADGFETLQ